MGIRPWDEGDLAQVVALLQELNEALGEDQVLDLETVKEHYLSMRNQGETYESYVFEEHGRVLGFLSIVFYRSVYHRQGTALVNELVVTRRERGRKIGEALLQRAIDRARERGMDELEVGVMKDNVDAIAFYKRQGVTEEYLLLGMEFDDIGVGAGA
ncbi:MAG TPA: GNAT family N-acetyltransferase [Rectinemataceae bacterium]|nr:GNAT family N-acetyltransferase [Rectinemataceae bacterium]